MYFNLKSNPIIWVILIDKCNKADRHKLIAPARSPSLKSVYIVLFCGNLDCIPFQKIFCKYTEYFFVLPNKKRKK